MAESDLPAIAVEALRARIETAIADLPLGPVALVSSPWRAPEHGVFVHLHTLAPMSNRAARPSPRDPATTTGWALRLLVGAFGPDDLAIHRLMGRVARGLDATPVLDGASLATAAGRLGLEETGMAAHVAHILREDLGIDDMTRLWQRFAPMRYSLSDTWRITLA